MQRFVLVNEQFFADLVAFVTFSSDSDTSGYAKVLSPTGQNIDGRPRAKCELAHTRSIKNGIFFTHLAKGDWRWVIGMGVRAAWHGVSCCRRPRASQRAPQGHSSASRTALPVTSWPRRSMSV